MWSRSSSSAAGPNASIPATKRTMIATTIPPPHMTSLIRRGLTLGSSETHGALTPQEVHTSASRATGAAQRRHGTSAARASVLMRQSTAGVCAVDGSLHEDPFRLEQRKGDETDERSGSHEHGIADFPSEQHDETCRCNERREPVTNRDPSEQHACTENRPDRGGVCALDEPLNIGVRAVANEDRGDDEDQQERGKKDANRRNERPPEPFQQRAPQARRHEIPHERRGDDDGAGADHADRDGDEEVTFVEPTHLLDEPFLEKRHDHEPAAEGERAGFEKEGGQLGEELTDAGRCSGGDGERRAESEESRRRRRRAGAK